MYIKPQILRILLITTALMLTSCAPTGIQDPLTWLNFPLKLEGTLSINDSQCSLEAEFDTRTHGRITANTTEYMYTDGNITLGAKGMMLPIAITPPFIEFTAGIPAIDGSMLISTESDGETVKAEYRTETQTYTAVTDKNGTLLSITDGRFTFKPNEYTK